VIVLQKLLRARALARRRVIVNRRPLSVVGPKPPFLLRDSFRSNTEVPSGPGVSSVCTVFELSTSAFSRSYSGPSASAVCCIQPHIVLRESSTPCRRKIPSCRCRGQWSRDWRGLFHPDHEWFQNPNTRPNARRNPYIASPPRAEALHCSATAFCAPTSTGCKRQLPFARLTLAGIVPAYPPGKPRSEPSCFWPSRGSVHGFQVVVSALVSSRPLR
jgi:hypothetical protein